MAKCKGCGLKVRFGEGYCLDCKAKKLEIQTAKANLQKIESKSNLLNKTISEVEINFDRFTNTTEYIGKLRKIYIGDIKARLTCVNGEFWWLKLVHKPERWMWLRDNSTYVVFRSGARFHYPHSELRGHEVVAAFQVYEEHHIFANDFIDELFTLYETGATDDWKVFEIKVGQIEMGIPFDIVRDAMAIHTKMSNKVDPDS